MSSSTSSSEAKRAEHSETKTLLVVVLVLAALELWSFRSDASVGQDEVALAGFPATAVGLGARPKVRVVGLGNSQMLTGIDLDRLHREDEAAPGFRMELLALHGSSITEWTRLFDRCFIKPQVPVDIVLINVSPPPCDARDEALHDLRVEWIALESELSDAPGVVKKDFPTFALDARYLHALASRSFARREMIKTDFFARRFDNYWDGRNHLNDAAKNSSGGSPGTPPAASFEKLSRLVASILAHGATPILVVMPREKHDAAREECVAFAPPLGLEIWNLRHPPELQARHFDDDWHLNEKGALVLSDLLRGRLDDLVRKRK